MKDSEMKKNSIEILTLDLNVWVEAQCRFVIKMQNSLPAVMYTEAEKLT